MTTLVDLQAMIERFGGSLIIGEFSRDLEAPFNRDVGLDYSDKIIYAKHSNVAPTAVIHEMGHVFASDQEPFVCDEVAFLGWEYALSQEVGLVKEFKEEISKSYNFGWDMLQTLTTLEEIYPSIEMKTHVRGQLNTGWVKTIRANHLSDSLQSRVLGHLLTQCEIKGLVKNGKPIAIR